MDKNKLKRQKEILNIVKKKIGVTLTTTTLLIILLACKNNKNKVDSDVNTTEYQTITEALSEYTTEEITEALTIEYTTEEITEILTTEYTTEEVNTYSIDDEIINDFKKKKEEIKNLIDKDDIENAKAKAKEYFIKSVDFIFYDSTINGITFNELKKESKDELYKELCEIDDLISNVSPDYKENISEKYQSFKDFSKEKYNYSLDKIKEKIGEDKYNQIGEFKDNAKEKINNFKEDHQEDIDNIKEKTKEKTKEYKLKLKDWYENYKEE